MDISQDEITAKVYSIIRSEHQCAKKAKRSIIKILRTEIPEASIDQINAAIKELSK